MVRDLWLKIANALPEYNRELLFGKYENDTLPTRSIFFLGSKYFGDFNPQLSFNNEDLIRARVTVMCCHITCTSVKYYELLPLQEFAGLTLKKVDKD